MARRGFAKRRALRFTTGQRPPKVTRPGSRMLSYRGNHYRRRARWGNWGKFQPGSRWEPRNVVAPRTRASVRFSFGRNPMDIDLRMAANRRARNRRDRFGRFR